MIYSGYLLSGFLSGMSHRKDEKSESEHNEDLYGAFGYNQEDLLNHFLTSGMKEGRVASEAFNISVYKENNADLVQAFGDNLPAYYEHYMNFGYDENRICH